MRALLLILLMGQFAAVAQISRPMFMPLNAVGGVPDVLETFEATEFDLAGWTETATPDGDYTTTALAGVQSLLISGSTENTENINRSITATDSFYFYCVFQVKDALPAGSRTLVYVLNNTTSIGLCRVNTTGSIRIDHGSVNATTAGSCSVNTTYHLWIEWFKGTGADGVMRVGFSATGTKPALTSLTTGTSTLQATKMQLGSTSGAGAGDYILDTVKVSYTTAFGDNGTLP